MSSDVNNDAIQKTNIVTLLFLPLVIQEFGIWAPSEGFVSHIPEVSVESDGLGDSAKEMGIVSRTTWCLQSRERHTQYGLSC